MRAPVLALAAASTLLLGACDDDPTAAGPDPIATIAIDAGFTQLVAALQYVDAELDAGLVATFQEGEGPFTVFAPSDAAFESLYGLLTTVLGTPIDEITDVPASVVLDVLQYHVVAGRQAAANVLPANGERSVTTLLGETFAVRADGSLRDGLTGARTDARIRTADIAASNGIIHVIDQVVVPPSVVAALTGSAASLESAAAARAVPVRGDQPIAALAINGGFTELVGALQYVDAELGAGLVDLFLAGTDQYTVFAPTDAAFTELYALLGGVLGAPVDEIRDLPAPVVLDVLLYHVAEGRRAAVSVLPKRGERTITTLQGESFAVRVNGTVRDGLTGVRPLDAAIRTPDISASNGIIHVIDRVIVPPSVVAALTN